MNKDDHKSVEIATRFVGRLDQ